jgi:hypothetical protein
VELRALRIPPPAFSACAAANNNSNKYTTILEERGTLAVAVAVAAADFRVAWPRRAVRQGRPPIGTVSGSDQPKCTAFLIVFSES